MCKRSTASILQSNLSEIYSAMLEKEAVLPLRAISEQAVYHSRSWVALLHRFIHGKQSPENAQKAISYSINALFTRYVVDEGYTAYQQRVLNWIKLLGHSHAPNPLEPQQAADQKRRFHDYTKAAFGVTPENPNLPESVENVCQAFNQKLAEGALTDPKIDHIRTLITRCNQAVRPFWKLFIEPDNRLVEPIKHLALKQGTILNSTLYHNFKRLQCMIDLEGILEMDVPFVALAKLQNPDSLSLIEKHQIQRWINRLNEKKKEIPFKTFALALKEVVTVINIEGHYRTSIDKLIQALDQMGCEIIQREDPRHMQWREKLKPGSTISYKGKTLTLGQELGDKLVDNHFRVFSLAGEEHSGHVIKIARNRFQLILEMGKMQDDKWHWGIHPTRVIDDINEDTETEMAPLEGLDPQGRFVIVEKLDISLADCRWNSHTAHLTESDFKKALAISNHLYCMQQWEAVPNPLDPQHFMFDSKGILKSTIPLKKSPFSYNAIEQFVYLIGKGNNAIIHFIMHVSQLVKHKVALFYSEAVEFTLQTGKTNLLGLAQPKKFRSAQNEERVNELCKQALELRNECFKVIQAHFRRNANPQYQSEEELQNAVHTKLVEFYKASSTPGILSPSIKDAVLQHFLQTLPQAPQASPNLNPYYEAAFERMKFYNDSFKN